MICIYGIVDVVIVGIHSSMSIVTQSLNVQNVGVWIWLMNLKEGSMTK